MKKDIRVDKNTHQAIIESIITKTGKEYYELIFGRTTMNDIFE